MLLPRWIRLRAACFPSAAVRLPDPQSIISRSKSLTLHPLLQRPAEQPENSQLTPSPFPRIANPGLGREKRLPIADCRLPIFRFQPKYLIHPNASVATPYSNRQSRQVGIGNRQCSHHLTNTPPHVTPPPKEVIITRSPSLSFPDSTHSSRAMGIEADDVFPWTAMFEYTFEVSTFKRSATASVIR